MEWERKREVSEGERIQHGSSGCNSLFGHSTSLVGSLNVGCIVLLTVDGHHVVQSPRHGNQQTQHR